MVFHNKLQEFQFYDKYSRWNKELNRRETWEESIQRSVDFLRELSQNKLPEKDYQDIYNAMYNMEVFPSMRLFAMAGEAGRRDNNVLYNCSYLPIDSLESMKEVLSISMAGCGVGFSVEKEYIDQLPKPKERTGLIKTYQISDTAEGWCEAFYFGLQNWFDGNDVEFDYSLIRPAGTPLKTKTGRASGPKPLQELFDVSKEIIYNSRNRKLETIEVYDIVTKIGDCAVSGGSRRSAMICLFDRNDDKMLHAKDYGWWKFAPQRANANNSVVVDKDLTREEWAAIMYVMHNGGGGEPGFFVRKNVTNFAPRRKDNEKFGVNPSLRKGTPILTTNGVFPIEELVGKEFEIVNLNGEISFAQCFLSGKNQQLWEIELGNKTKYYATKEHDWPIVINGKIQKCKTEDLQRGMYIAKQKNLSLPYGNKWNYDEGFFVGWVLGDGCVAIRGDNNRPQLHITVSEADMEDVSKPILSVLQKYGSNCKLNKRERDGLKAWYEVNTTQSGILDFLLNEVKLDIKKQSIPQTLYTIASEEFRKGFVDGLFSSDGGFYIKKNSQRISLSSSRPNLLLDVKKLLGFYGIESTDSVRETKNAQFPNGKDYNRTYISSVLRIDKSSDRQHFGKCFKLTVQRKNEQLKQMHMRQNIVSSGIVIKSTEPTNLYEDVYDITVYDNVHCFQIDSCLSGNCGEVVLRPREMCNLSQSILRNTDTIQTLRNKIRIATILGTIQSLATYFPNLRQQWKDNCDEERLLGVDITGQLDNIPLLTEDNLSGLKQLAIDTNKKYAEILGINQSVAITVVKPSGNSSILFDCSPGLHPRWSKYYIRRVRVNANSPIRQLLEYHGLKLYPENGQKYETANTLVVEFPVKSPDNAICRNDFTAMQQLEHWKKNKLFYTEHNPSMTCYYKPEELERIIDWIFENQDIVGGISFLPGDEHYYPLAPYEEITKEKYEEMLLTFPEIDFSLLQYFETEDNTSVSQEIACVAGVCEL